jgi:predicted RNase H-like HicB family nuclease
MKLVYPAVFYPLENQPGFAVEIPDLPGCVTQGEDMANAIEMAIDAASGWVLDELESGNAAPTATPAKDITPDEPNGIVSLVMLDMDSYAEMHGNKAVRKNTTIPAWLATIADKRNVNYSQSLQRALVQELQLAQ